MTTEERIRGEAHAFSERKDIAMLDDDVSAYIAGAKAERNTVIDEIKYLIRQELIIPIGSVDKTIEILESLKLKP
jgi:hypothetical protein